MVWHEATQPPITGKEAVRVRPRSTFRAFQEITWPKEDVRVFSTDDPKYTSMVGTMPGRMDPGFAPTGKRMTVTGSCLQEFRDGLIRDHSIVFDGVDAMQQLGPAAEAGEPAALPAAPTPGRQKQARENQPRRATSAPDGR